MSVSTILLIVLALLPAAGLLFYIYKMDRVDKEPKGLLTGLFFIGVGSVIPAMILEMLLHSCLNALFFGVFSSDEPTYFSGGVTQFFYYLLYSFVIIALIEEGCKWLFAFLLTHKSKSFNCLFDGVVYTVFVSLGFAAAENILYVFQYGIGNAIARMLTAVPGHCFFGVIMGYFYSKWHLTHQAGQLESHLRMNRIIPAGASNFRSGGLLVLSIIAPTLAHGFYDFCALMDHWIYIILFLLFMGFLYFLCFRGVSKLRKIDAHNSYLSMAMVLKKHPQAAAYVSTMPEYSIYFYQPAVQQPMPVQPAQPVQGSAPYGQPVQGSAPYAQPVQGNQPYARPVQGNTPYGQPVQGSAPYAQPVQGNNQPYARPVQGNAPYGQPVQGNPPYEHPVQQQGYDPNRPNGPKFPDN